MIQNFLNIEIENRRNCQENVTVQGFDLPPGNVATYFPESNALISEQSDKRSKTPGFKSTMVNISPLVSSTN